MEITNVRIEIPPRVPHLRWVALEVDGQPAQAHADEHGSPYVAVDHLEKIVLRGSDVPLEVREAVAEVDRYIRLDALCTTWSVCTRALLAKRALVIAVAGPRPAEPDGDDRAERDAWLDALSAWDAKRLELLDPLYPGVDWAERARVEGKIVRAAGPMDLGPTHTLHAVLREHLDHEIVEQGLALEDAEW